MSLIIFLYGFMEHQAFFLKGGGVFQEFIHYVGWGEYYEARLSTMYNVLFTYKGEYPK